MPSTPFHIPPSTVVAFPLRRHLDLPTFLLANLTIDIEPAVAMLLDLDPPPHGYAHTLLGATVVGAATGWVVWRVARRLRKALSVDYPLRRNAALLSGITGCWLHVLLDAIMYSHLRPFFPVDANPLYRPGSAEALHVVCALLFLPAAALLVRHRYWRTLQEKITLGLLAASAVGMVAVAAAGGI